MNFRCRWVQCNLSRVGRLRICKSAEEVDSTYKISCFDKLFFALDSNNCRSCVFLFTLWIRFPCRVFALLICPFPSSTEIVWRSDAPFESFFLPIVFIMVLCLILGICIYTIIVCSASYNFTCCCYLWMWSNLSSFLKWNDKTLSAYIGRKHGWIDVIMVFYKIYQGVILLFIFLLLNLSYQANLKYPHIIPIRLRIVMINE